MILGTTAREAADMLRTASSAVVFSGAGISTPSGIPDFRSPHSGLWENTDPMKVASLYGFRQNPEAFYRWIYPLAQLIYHAQPNPAHAALASLESLGHIQAVITQNIDMLHTKAGSRVVYELHGHLREATCIHCFRVFAAEQIIEQYLQDHRVPHCPDCHGVLKPNVILFGEQLPVQQLLRAQDAVRQTNLMIVVGSSLEVAPASDLPVMARQRGARLIIINLQATHLDSLADLVIHDDAAEVLPDILHYLET